MTISIARRLALSAAVLVAACGPSPQVSPPATPPAATSLATPLTSAAPSATVEQLLDAMAAAVLAGDRDGYLALVDQSDPVFALEHGRWADDWAGRNPVRDYTLAVADLEADGGAATGELTVGWAMDGQEGPRTATFSARFTRGPAGWRYAGELWSATETPNFRVLAGPGLDAAVAAIVANLAEVHETVTAELEYEPDVPMQIKVYPNGAALAANTLLSLPDVAGWNEPGEALKLQAEAGPPFQGIVAHEFTHFACFDRAGTRRTLMPWWLDEGIATFVASAIEGQGSGAPDRIGRVAEWARAGELPEWEAMAVFEETPQDLWQFVYPQGYALVRYVTETYGRSARNAWLASMATKLTIDAATPAAFGVSFEQLDGGFRDWLAVR